MLGLLNKRGQRQSEGPQREHADREKSVLPAAPNAGDSQGYPEMSRDWREDKQSQWGLLQLPTRKAWGGGRGLEERE